ncbi:MAG: class IV adenylate cyclase [Lachnospiraceae bacterium]|nr:class IV adenylate cyclase [Lachnospiraceae bacterium]
MIEVEIKAELNPVDIYQKKLLDNGFVFKECVLEKDIYLDNDKADIRTRDTALRVRTVAYPDTEESYSYITFKGVRTDDESMTRPEFETGVDSAEVALSIFKSLGYSPVYPFVIKKRNTYIKDDITACIDEVEDLGTYLELEILTEESEKEASLSRLWEILSDIGLSKSTVTTKSYLSKLQERITNGQNND